MKKKIIIAIISLALILLTLYLFQTVRLIDDKTATLPFIGTISLSKASIPLVALILGTIDGFNPCAMWVLILLITMLIGMKDKKRMWILGSTFLLTTGIMYFFILMGLITVVREFSVIYWIRIGIALVAIIGGAINLRNYFNTPDDGCEVVDDKKRFKIIDQIKHITTEKSIIISFIGVIALAISVNLIELACSAGLPTVFANVLDANNVNFIQQIMYTLIYVLFFLLDDLLIFGFAVSSYKMLGISTKFGKYSHLIGGLIMVIMGLLIILKPEWLSLAF